MKKNFCTFSIRGKSFYEGEGSGAPTSPPAPPPPPPPPPTPEKVFKQPEVDEIVTKRTKELREQNQRTVQQLEQLQQNQRLTQEEKDNLQRQIDELKSTYETKEQQQKNDFDRYKGETEKKEKKLTEERDSWKARFENRIKRQEVATTFASDAYNVRQVESLLLPELEVFEQIEDGQPTGEFGVRVKNFEGRDGKGNPVPLKNLSLADVKKAMIDMPDVYGNLFKANINGGAGIQPSGGAATGPIGDIDNMSPQEYAKKRDEIRKKMAESK